MNQNLLTHLQIALREQRVVRRHKDFRNRGGLNPIQIVGNRRERRFGHRDVFRLRAAAGNAENSIADCPNARVFAGAFNLTGELKPGNVLRIAGWRWIATEALQDVRAIQSRRLHSHTDAIRRWLRRVRDFYNLQSLNAAERNDLYRFHASGILTPPYCREFSVSL